MVSVVEGIGGSSAKISSAVSIALGIVDMVNLSNLNLLSANLLPRRVACSRPKINNNYITDGHLKKILNNFINK